MQMTIYKGIEEHGGGRIIQMVICNNPCSPVPLILVILRAVLFANDHMQKNGGGRIIQMIGKILLDAILNEDTFLT